MKPLGFGLLTDENIHPDVARELRTRGKDIRTAQEEGLVGAPDVAVIRRAHELGRVLLTHDRDFGRLALLAGEPIIGIIYLRPGHVDAGRVLEVIAAIETRDDDVTPPFIVVAERREDRIRVRVRQFGP